MDEAEAEFHGTYYDFPLVKSYPKPAQTPHPPVLLGGHAKTVLERVVTWGDGWLPNRITPEQLGESRATLDRLDAGATRVIVRPPVVKTESEMGAELTRIAEAVLR